MVIGMDAPEPAGQRASDPTPPKELFGEEGLRAIEREAAALTVLEQIEVVPGLLFRLIDYGQDPRYERVPRDLTGGVVDMTEEDAAFLRVMMDTHVRLELYTRVAMVEAERLGLDCTPLAVTLDLPTRDDVRPAVVFLRRLAAMVKAFPGAAATVTRAAPPEASRGATAVMPEGMWQREDIRARLTDLAPNEFAALMQRLTDWRKGQPKRSDLAVTRVSERPRYQYPAQQINEFAVKIRQKRSR